MRYWILYQCWNVLSITQKQSKVLGLLDYQSVTVHQVTCGVYVTWKTCNKRCCLKLLFLCAFILKVSHSRVPLHICVSLVCSATRRPLLSFAGLIIGARFRRLQGSTGGDLQPAAVRHAPRKGRRPYFWVDNREQTDISRHPSRRWDAHVCCRQRCT